MKTNITILTALVLLLSITVNAQVAINTDGTSPDASTMLDIQSTNRGTSFPNLNIADMSTAAPVTSPKTGLIAYNTNSTTGPGLVMWTGSRWVMFELAGVNWSLTGNSGTTVGTNFIGTTDNVDFATYTNNAERMRVMSTGEVTINNTAPYSGDMLSAWATGSNWAINGYSATGPAVYGQSSEYYSVYGSSAYRIASVRARSTNATGTGLLASGNNQGGSYLGTGTGIATSGADGIYAKATDSDGTAVLGVGNNGGTAYSVPQGSGGAFYGYHGLFGKGSNTSNGIGVIGVGNDSTTFHYVSGGNGGAFSGAQAGVYGYATKTSDGTGVIGVGNRSVTYKLHTGIGSGGAFASDVCGVYGYASNTSGDRYGGYFEINNSLAHGYVGAEFGGTTYKIIGTGTVSTLVKDLNENDVIMYCPEAPEVLFQDYGIGQLINGKTHIALDPILSKNIHVSENHPMKVFVTLEGDCNGIYITNKSSEGFDVIELRGGTSNVSFSWQIVATRANEEFVQKDGNLGISDYSKRFPTGPSRNKNRGEDGVELRQEIQQKITETTLIEKTVDDKEKIEETGD